MKTLLRERLVECGWKDQIHMMCRQIVKERGVNIKVDELIAEITPKARGESISGGSRISPPSVPYT
uniref:Enhancer of yellow 2 transcription factor n=1 Tax=Timema monikensis TaxID=170555 RepID=A0A7R9HVA9_9NEOP|nr:unnamed protein product [Timema monikensis]